MIFLLLLAILTTTISSEDTIDLFQKYDLQKYNITMRNLSDFLDILKLSKVNHSIANDASDGASSIDSTPYAPYQNDYASTPDYVTTELSIDDDYGETSSIGTTPYAPYQNDYTSSPYDASDLSIDSNDSTEAKKRFITDTQLEMTMDAVAKVVAIEIQREKFSSTWEYLNKLNFDNEQIIASVVNITMDIEHLSECNRLNNLLSFINHTTDVDMRLFAYNTLFHEISYDPLPSKQTTNWLSLQHFVSHDVSIDSNSQYQNLLTEIESKTNDVLDSPFFDQLDDCTSLYWSSQTIYSEYLIKRLCSTDPAKIQVLWKIIRNKGLPGNAVLQFVKELERNDRLNYTIMALPHIRSKWCTIYSQPNICQQLLDIIPERSTLRDFLTDTNEFYIKNVYSDEYLCYGSDSDSYSYLYQSTRSPRIFTCGMKNSTWTFGGRDGFLIASGDGSSRNIALEKCEHHNDWYIALKEESYSTFYGYYKNEEFDWELETDNVVNNQFRLKSPKTGGYLRVGPNDDLLISIPECNQSDERKSEWIVERSLYYYLNDDGEIETRSSELTDANEEEY